MAVGWQGFRMRARAWAAARFFRWPMWSFLFRLGAKPSRMIGLAADACGRGSL
jgi:hypothetical protein